MKTALVIAYVLIVLLIVVVVMQHFSIAKLTPSKPGPGGRMASSSPVSFGDLIDKVQQNAKDLEMKVTFNN